MIEAVPIDNNSPSNRGVASSPSRGGVVITPLFFLRFQLPSYELYDLDATGLSGLFVKDIKRRLQQVAALHVLPARMKFVYNGRALKDQEIIGDIGFSTGDIIQVIIRVVEQEAIYSGYDEFIESSYPKHLAINVSIHVHIRIALKANSFGHILYTPALMDYKLLYTMSSGFHRDELLTTNTGNLIPPPHANRLEHRPYRTTHRWIDIHFTRRVFLLKVEDNLDLTIDQMRYNLLDITKRGYTTALNGEGDLHSWQRYTKEMPIDCDLSVSPHEERLPHSITLHPLQPLEHNTTYAILLCNHVPTVPVHYPHDDFDFLADGVGEDKLIVFKTEKEHELHRRDRHGAHSAHHRRSSRGSSSHRSHHLHSSSSPLSSPRSSQHHHLDQPSNHHHREHIFHPENFQAQHSPRSHSTHRDGHDPHHYNQHHSHHNPHSNHHDQHHEAHYGSAAHQATAHSSHHDQSHHPHGHQRHSSHPHEDVPHSTEVHGTSSPRHKRHHAHH